MKYTENYHLPQWVKTDRIMMDDFNQMCADIEKGLTSNAAGSKASLDRTCRLAYNHYNAVQEMDPVPWQLGMFRQDPIRDFSGMSIYNTLDGVYIAAKTELTLTPEILMEGAETVTQLQLNKSGVQNTPLTVNFRPAATGIIKNYGITGSYSNCAVDATFRCRLTLTNQDTGVVEKTFEMTHQYAATVASFSLRFKEDLPVVGGVNYLITVQPLTKNCTMTADFCIDSNSRVRTYSNDGVVDASYQFHEQEAGMGGMAIIRCMATGEGGSMTFLWDGVERQPDIVRQAIFRGKGYRELIYLRDDEIPENSELSLHFACNMDGNFLLYDWGAILF